MACKFRDDLKRSGMPPLSKEGAISVLMRNRYDLIDITDDDAFRDEIATHTKTYVDAGTLLDA